MCIWKYAASQHRLGTQPSPKRARSRARQIRLGAEPVDWEYGAGVKGPVATPWPLCQVSASQVGRLGIGMALGWKPASAYARYRLAVESPTTVEKMKSGRLSRMSSMMARESFSVESSAT